MLELDNFAGSSLGTFKVLRSTSNLEAGLSEDNSKQPFLFNVALLCPDGWGTETTTDLEALCEGFFVSVLSYFERDLCLSLPDWWGPVSTSDVEASFEDIFRFKLLLLRPSLADGRDPVSSFGQPLSDLGFINTDDSEDLLTVEPPERPRKLIN